MENFNLNLDPKALVEQDKEFADFAAHALLTSFLSDKQAGGVVGVLYGFYQIGMTKEQVAQWIRSVQMFGQQPPKENQ